MKPAIIVAVAVALSLAAVAGANRIAFARKALGS